MSLLQLPPETLIQIFDYVGSYYFRSDLSRLTVCKQWSKFAHTTCFRDFYVTQKTLRRLLSSPYVESSLPLVKDSGRAVRAAWTTELNNDLLYLATIIKQSRKLRILRILRIQATKRRDYLFLSTIRAFLSASNLTSIKLDLCGTRLIPHQSQEHGEGFHVCTSIAAPYYATTTNLRLNEMLINLSLSNESPLTTSAAHATCCGSSPGGFLQLKADMEKQAQDLVAQMAAPKIVRILTHALPSIEMRAFDVLTGRNVTLSEGAEWDDDGEAIEDEVHRRLPRAVVVARAG
ncbi:hypothetical protein BU23DRAFT_576932 [Bimuria novae-zelandiae CBS 107.79]|uniref:F-box domain-containing protein n=1 Tax=Bimuria novae-zelandiae CBS 107.79 TaxID=1447943 RepID=A0A6A5VPX4_9PLEO|nr:hypothetical protein BU23DRAFT_576932 [Bimuria novae-zelandiae CBS 107.79]